MALWIWLLIIGAILYFSAQIIIMPNGLLIHGPLASTDFLNVVTVSGVALVWFSGSLFAGQAFFSILGGIALGASGTLLFLAGFSGTITEIKKNPVVNQRPFGFGWFLQIAAVVILFLSGYF